MQSVGIRLILFFYLLTSTGLKVTAHWCGSELTTFELACHEDDRHCACPVSEPAGCCSEIQCKLTGAQHQNSQQANAPVFTRCLLAAHPLPIFLHGEFGTAIEEANEISYMAQTAEEGEGRYLYLRKCCFRT